MTLSALNFGAYPMSNGLSRLATRFLGEPESVEAAKAETGKPLEADVCEASASSPRRSTISTGTTRCASSSRSARPSPPTASPGMEANLRFAGPETMETKIFGRLTAWQNWIFQRPNAAGAEGALKRYGTGVKAKFNPERV